MRDENGLSIGCGIVEFETLEEAQDAIETLHDTELDNRKILVRIDRGLAPKTSKAVGLNKHQNSTGHKIYVGNVSSFVF